MTLCPESAPSGNFFKIDEKMLKEEWCEKETGSGIQKELKVNVVPGSNAESTFDLKLGLEKKRKLFKEEKLSLVCEWAGCGETETNPDIFNWHVAKHCHEAGVAVFCFLLPFRSQLLSPGAAESPSPRGLLPLPLDGLWLQDALLPRDGKTPLTNSNTFLRLR